MNVANLAWLTLGACLVYIVAQDPKVYDWLVLQAQRLFIEVYRRWLNFRYDPEGIWVRYQTQRNANRIAQEFIKEREKG